MALTESYTSSPHNHWLRGRINTATLALYVAQKQLERDARSEASEAIRQAIELFENLEAELRRAPRSDQPGNLGASC